MSSSSQSFWDRMPEPVRRDPKKSALLAGLSVMLVVMGARQLGGSGAPAQASAASSAAITSIDSVPALNSAISKEASNPQAEVAQRVAQWLGTPIKPLDRNLFETKLEFFQRIDSTANDKASILADETFWDQLAKSLASQADQKRQKVIRSENLQLAASSLKLQTTIMGTVPKALIDGRMVRAGDIVEARSSTLSLSFRVMQIEARRIVVEHDGVKLELRMGAGQAKVLSE